jgi:hypothetical protein
MAVNAAKKRPPVRVATVYTVPVGTCVAVIVAPVSASPLLFLIVPVILLVVTCALAAEKHTRRSIAA